MDRTLVSMPRTGDRMINDVNKKEILQPRCIGSDVKWWFHNIVTAQLYHPETRRDIFVTSDRYSSRSC